MSLTAAQARKIVQAFDGVERKSALGGGEAYHLSGAFLVQIGTREPDTLMLKYPTLDERDMMLEAHPDVLYITDHFRNYKGLLVRLSALDARMLRALLQQRIKAIGESPARKRKVPPKRAG